MSFFRRDEEPDATPPARRPASPSTPSTGTGAGQQVTRIAGGTRITGEISGTTELLIEGEVDGKVRLDGRVVVGQAGGLKGEIQARSVRIDGRVEGPVRGSERVEVGATGRLDGDIRAPRVTIAEGAFFKGKVEMGGDDRRSASKPEPPARDDRRESPGLFPDGPAGDEGASGASGASGGTGATGEVGATGATGAAEGTGGSGAKGTEGDGGRGGRA